MIARNAQNQWPGRRSISRKMNGSACGPMPMLAALARVVSRLNLPAEFSTEAEMVCGFGVCLGCVIPGTEKAFLISCQEGPILPPEKIAWEKV